MQKVKIIIVGLVTIYTLIFTYNRFDLYEIPYDYKDYRIGDKVNYIKKGEASFKKWTSPKYNDQYRDIIVGNDYGTYISCESDFEIHNGSILCKDKITPLGGVEDTYLNAGTYIYNGVEYKEISIEDISGVIKNDRIINKH